MTKRNRAAISLIYPVSLVLILIASCNSRPAMKKYIQLYTLDPGHFHAALVQKSMYENVDSVVEVFAPDGPDLDLHLQRIEAYNKRVDRPTHWVEETYRGNDFFQKMLAYRDRSDKTIPVLVLSGNNEKKSDYILQSLQHGFNVLADKPMVIDSAGFEQLKKAFRTASEKDLLLYDIMTERFEITSKLQKELSQTPEIFGTLVQGSPENPAVVQESVHFLHKIVSGRPLIRPAWFMDTRQQGEGIADVMTHLVDLVQWECFPGQSIRYDMDITVDSARHWPTRLTLSQFRTITGLDSFPEFLQSLKVNDSSLAILFNGEIHYRLRGIQVRTRVEWRYEAPAGSGDTHFALMRGTKANLVIRQEDQQGFEPTLYIVPLKNDSDYHRNLEAGLQKLAKEYPGLNWESGATGVKLLIPPPYREGHEAHFARVTENFLQWLRADSLPGWEVPGMLAKYYTTTRALELANKSKP